MLSLLLTLQWTTWLEREASGDRLSSLYASKGSISLRNSIGAYSNSPWRTFKDGVTWLEAGLRAVFDDGVNGRTVL